MAAPSPKNETERLRVLQHYGIMDSLPEDSFNDIVYLASEICEVPVCLISFIDETRQWFKAKKGLETCETSRDLAFCAHTILNDEILVVPDATKDARFYNNPLVLGEPYVRFYAGAPLISPSRHKLGTLCIIDHQPRQLSTVQLNSIKILAKQVVKLLELRSRNQLLQKKFVLIQKQKDAIRRFWYEREELLAKLNALN
jgi:GAF domain-containing protein